MMDEYVSKETVLAILCATCSASYKKSCEDCEHYVCLKASSPVDVVPVVRCKDCKYFEDMRHYTGLGWCTEVGDTRSKDWYCADGERRE